MSRTAGTEMDRQQDGYGPQFYGLECHVRGARETPEKCPGWRFRGRQQAFWARWVVWRPDWPRKSASCCCGEMVIHGSRNVISTRQPCTGGSQAQNREPPTHETHQHPQIPRYTSLQQRVHLCPFSHALVADVRLCAAPPSASQRFVLWRVTWDISHLRTINSSDLANRTPPPSPAQPSPLPDHPAHCPRQMPSTPTGPF